MNKEELRQQLLSCQQIVTHAHCGDGAVAAIIASQAMGKSVPVRYIQHGRGSTLRLPNKRTLFVDMVPARGDEGRFRKNGSVVLDHHIHAKDVVDSFEYGLFDNDRCGSTILTDVLFFDAKPSKYKPDGYEWAMFMSRLVEIHDLFRVDHSMFYEAAGYVELLRTMPEGYGVRYEMLPRDTEMVIGDELWRKASDAAFNAWKHGVTRKVGSLTYRVVSGPQYSTAIAALFARNEMDVLDSDIDAVAAFRLDADGSVVWSLRALRDGVDVGAIAKANGGGGHVGAAGFRSQKTSSVKMLATQLWAKV